MTWATYGRWFLSWMTSIMPGQSRVKRAIEITSAGGYNLIMIGPPGAGEAMLALRLPTILI